MAGVTIQVTPDVEAVLRRTGTMVDGLAAALAAGLAQAVDLAAGEVVLTAAADGIESRTGALLGSVRGEPEFEGALRGVVGVPEDSPAARYAYLLGEEDKAITPRQGRYLTIPIAENLTAAGVPRYATVASLAAQFGEDALAFVGRTVGVRTGSGAYFPYFALVESVLIFGRGSLPRGVERAQDEMVAAVRERVRALLDEA